MINNGPSAVELKELFGSKNPAPEAMYQNIVQLMTSQDDDRAQRTQQFKAWHTKLSNSTYLFKLASYIQQQWQTIDVRKNDSLPALKQMDQDLSLACFFLINLWPDKIKKGNGKSSKDPASIRDDMIHRAVAGLDCWLETILIKLAKCQLPDGQYYQTLDRYSHNLLLLESLTPFLLESLRQSSIKRKRFDKDVRQQDVCCLLEAPAHRIKMATLLQRDLRPHLETLEQAKSTLLKTTALAKYIGEKIVEYKKWVLKEVEHRKTCTGIENFNKHPMVTPYLNVLNAIDRLLSTEFDRTNHLLTCKASQVLEFKADEESDASMLKSIDSCLSTIRITPQEALHIPLYSLLGPLPTLMAHRQHFDIKTFAKAVSAFETFAKTYLQHEHLYTHLIEERLGLIIYNLKEIMRAKVRESLPSDALKPKPINVLANVKGLGNTEVAAMTQEDMPKSLKKFLQANPHLQVSGVKIMAQDIEHELSPAEQFIYAQCLRDDTERAQTLERIMREYGKDLKREKFMLEVLGHFNKFCFHCSDKLYDIKAHEERRVALLEYLDVFHYIIHTVLPFNKNLATKHRASYNWMMLRVLSEAVKLIVAMGDHHLLDETIQSPQAQFKPIIEDCHAVLLEQLRALPKKKEMPSEYLHPKMVLLSDKAVPPLLFANAIIDLVNLYFNLAESATKPEDADYYVEKAVDLIDCTQEKLEHISYDSQVDFDKQRYFKDIVAKLCMVQQRIAQKAKDALVVHTLKDSFAEITEEDIIADLEAGLGGLTLLPSSSSNGNNRMLSFFSSSSNNTQEKLEEAKQTIEAQKRTIAKLEIEIESIEALKQSLSEKNAFNDKQSSTIKKLEKELATLKRKRERQIETHETQLDLYRKVKAERDQVRDTLQAQEARQLELLREKHELQEQRNNQESKIATLSESLRTAKQANKSKIISLGRENKQLTSENDALTRSLETLKASLEESQATLEASQKEAQKLRSDLGKIKKEHQKLMREAQRKHKEKEQQLTANFTAHNKKQSAVWLKTQQSFEETLRDRDNTIHELSQQMAALQLNLQSSHCALQEKEAVLQKAREALALFKPKSTVRDLSSSKKINKAEVLKALNQQEERFCKGHLHYPEELTTHIKLIKKLLAELEGETDKAYIHGGFIRSLFLEQIPNDTDIVTTREPKWIRENLHNLNENKYIPGLFHDPINKIDLVCVPDLDLIHEAHSSLLSCNTLFVDKHLKLYDPTGKGIRDIKGNRLKIIGEPNQRLKEDPVRILRLIRFWCELGWQMPQEYTLPIKTYAKYFSKVPFGHFSKHLRHVMSLPTGLQALCQASIIGEIVGCDFYFYMQHAPNILNFWDHKLKNEPHGYRYESLLLLLPYIYLTSATGSTNAPSSAGEAVDDYIARWQWDPNFFPNFQEKLEYRTLLIEDIIKLSGEYYAFQEQALQAELLRQQAIQHQPQPVQQVYTPNFEQQRAPQPIVVINPQNDGKKTGQKNKLTGIK